MRGLLSLVGWLRTKFPGADLSILERLVKGVGHRELGDLAELAGLQLSLVVASPSASEAVLPDTGPVTVADSAGLRLGGHVVNLRCHERKPRNPWRKLRVS